MRKLFFLLLLGSPAFAQRTVDAKEIFTKINRKEPVSYNNVTITGDLDLTELSNKRRVNDDRWVGAEAYKSRVEVPLTFKNCIFKGKVLAYKNSQQENRNWNGNGITYSTDFTESLTFEDCTFEDVAAFKYSDCRQRALFTGCNFRDEALFKYTHFRAASDFSGSRFAGHANFKYTSFGEETAFQKSRFGRYADFKYTKFSEGVSFRNARFDETADFKYTHLPQGSTFEEAVFDGSTDFKYATLNGRKFSPR